MSSLTRSLRRALGKRFTATLSLVAGVSIMAAGLFPGVLTSAAATGGDIDGLGLFELDGNIAQDATTPPTYDWSCVFDNPSGHAGCPPPSAVMPSKVFQPDYVTPDTTYFASNKDIQDVNQWGCVTLNTPTPKDDILNAYGAAFIVPSTNAYPQAKWGHLVVYLAQERASNNGDSYAGFWLMQHQHSCTNGSFSGNHDPGDLLVVSNYTKGGTTPTVSLYEWNTSATNNLLQLGATGLTCGGTGTTDLCGITNTDNITEPWAPNQTLAPNQFLEEGVDITSLLPVPASADGVCFSQFLSETRSSQEVTATLKDYTMGQFHLCVTPTVTTQQTANNVTAATQTVLAGTAVTDQASLSGVIMGTPGGTIDYKLFEGSNCNGTVFYDSGALPLVNGVPPPSGPATPTAAGQYEWQAFYSGDIVPGTSGRNAPSASTCGDEPLAVVDASIGIKQSAVNQVGTAHTFTITANAYVPAGTSVAFNSITASAADAASATPDLQDTNTCSNPTVNGSTATCTLTINSSAVDTFIANAAATFALGGVTVHRSTDSSSGPPGPHGTGPATKSYVNATIGILPAAAVNLVGAPHIFTITVTALPGGVLPVLFGPVTTSVVDAANVAPTFQSTTCNNPTVNGNTATCTLTINNSTPDTFTATATDTVTMGGLPVTVSTNGQDGNSGPGTKTYGNGSIAIAPSAVNEVGTPHTFTVTVTGVPGANTTFSSITTSVLDSQNHVPDLQDTSTCNNPVLTKVNTSDVATCTVIINSSTADVFTANATATVTVNGFSAILTTVGKTGVNGPATKTYVDALIAVTPATAVNEVGSQHVFKVTVTGLQASEPFWVSSITTSVLDSQNHAPGTMSTTCGSPTVVGNVATCTITINSSSADVFTANATANVLVDGLALTRSTNSAVAPHGPNGTGPATKTYVDAAIAIAQSAVNEVGHQHIFTVTVTGLPSDQPFSVSSITTSVLDSQNNAPGTMSTTCGSPVVNANVATCTITINSTTADVFTANATANVMVDGLALLRSTNSAVAPHGPNGSGPATKTYVDAAVAISPHTAENAVGQQHVFTVTVTGLPVGQTYSFDSITTSVLDAQNQAPGTMSTTCGTPVVNGNVATCTITIDNPTADTFFANATAVVTIDGLQVTRSTTGNAGPNGTGPASKAYVDASVGIGLTAVNPIGQQHTFTIVVNAYSQGQTPINFVSITPSVAPQPLSSSTTCGNPTVTPDATGAQATCTLTINNDLPNIFTANVTAQVQMGTVTVTRSTATNPGPGGTGPATKTYVSANIGLSPLNATDPVGDLHTLTATVTTNNGSGDVPVAQPQPAPIGTVVSFSIVSGPGSLASPSCTISNNQGTCTDVLTSSVEGTTVVQATTTLTVDRVQLTRTTNDSVPGDSVNAVKNWHKVQPSITTTQTPGGTVGTSVSDTATVSGGLNPTGTVTFQLFGPGDTNCTGTPVFVSSNQPLSGGVAHSGSYTPTATGTFQWVATYNGDAANLTAVSACGSEPVTIVAAGVLGITTPNTGAGLTEALAEGLGLVLAGTGMVVWARRRRHLGD